MLTESITDAATELAVFAEEFRKRCEKEAKKRVYQLLSERLDMPEKSPEFMEIVAALRGRAASLRNDVETVTDDETIPELRNQALAAIDKFGPLFGPIGLSKVGQQAAKDHLDRVGINNIQWFGSILRKRQPLRLIGAEEIESAVSELADLEAEVRAGAFPEFVQDALIAGIARLRLVLRFLPGFGHRAAIDAFVALHRDAIVFEHLGRNGRGHHGGSRPSERFFSKLAKLAMMFCLPANIAIAADVYQGWYLDWAAKPTLLLPAPEQAPRSSPSREAVMPLPPKEQQREGKRNQKRGAEEGG